MHHLTKYIQIFLMFEQFELHVYSHQDVEYGSSGSFSYDAAEKCPASSRACAGNGCQNYIRYSPYGQWTVRIYDPVSQGVDITKLVAIRFEFKVTYGEIPGPLRTFFGKNVAQYPQNLGSLCHRHEVMAESVSMALQPDIQVEVLAATSGSLGSLLAFFSSFISVFTFT